MDFLADFQFAMRGERTFAIATFEIQRRTREMTNRCHENGDDITVTNSLRWMPSAFFYQNELAFARMQEQLVLPLVDLTNRTVSSPPIGTDEVDSHEHDEALFALHSLALMVFPALARA